MPADRGSTIALAFFVATLIAAPVPALESGDAVALGDVVIGLQRSTCLGTCPSYDLIIHGNGRVVYEGHEYVARTGRIDSSIDKAAVVGLVNRFLSACFFEFPSMCDVVDEVSIRGDSLDYSAYCPSRIERSTTLSLKLGDLEHSVVLRRREPVDLTQLAQAIDDAVNIRRWTKACAGPVPIGSAPVACSPEMQTAHHEAGTVLEVVVLQDGSVAEAFRHEDRAAVAYPAYRYGGILVCGDMPIALFESIREQIVKTLQPDQSISEIINYLTIQESSGSPAALGVMGHISGHVAVRICTANANWKCREETIRWFARVGDAFVMEGGTVNINRD